MKKLIILFIFPLTIVAQKPIFVKATVKSATVYFNAAELSQSVTMNLPKGSSEIVIKNVADYLNESTIQIGAPASITILSVQFSNKYMSEFEVDEKNPAIKKVRDSVDFVKKTIRLTENSRETDEKAIELLNRNQQVWGNNNGLNVAELTKMVTYYKQTLNSLKSDIDAYNLKISTLSEQLTSLENKLQTNTEKEEKSSKGKIILQVMNEVAGTADITVNYITNNATWKPFYDLRANNVSEPINMLYKAQISQNTGVDWKKVKLTLSSGNPNQNNAAPELNSWFLKYKNTKSEDYNAYENTSLDKRLQGRVSGLSISGSAGSTTELNDVVIRGTASIKKTKDPLYVINGVVSSENSMKNLNPNAIKSINVLKAEQAIAAYGSDGENGVILITTKQMSDYTNIAENELNVSFDIDIPYDVLSNGKVHSVALKEFKLPATYEYYAAPRIEKDAFLTAKIIDYASFNLLPGEANIVFEGLYVGKTSINANATSDTLTLSMGRDKKIAVKREKVADKSGVKFLSSKKEQTFTYDIIIRNNKKDAVEIVVKDQYPLSTEDAIETELLESSGAHKNTETGILTWKLNLKPAETRKIRLSYKVRYPKDKALGNL